MKQKIIFGLIAVISTTGLSFAQELKPGNVFNDIEKQTHVMLEEIPKARAARSGATNGVTPGSEGQELVSPRTLDSGKLKLVSSRDWTSGFFPGELWFLYEYTGKPEWRTEAEKY